MLKNAFMRLKKGHIVIIFMLTVLLGASCVLNVYLFRVNRRVKNALVPSISNDYLQNQIFITKSAKEFEEERDPYYTDGVSGELTVENGAADKRILDVKRISQLPDYPNGCEAASATMLLNFHGVDIRLKSFIEDYLPTAEVYAENGTRFGPNPALFYAGDPGSKDHGWGCYAPVIESALKRIVDPKAYTVVNYSNTKISDLTEHLPVVIWTLTDYSEANTFYQWFSYDKSRTYTYSRKTHAVVLIGFDSEYYYINDPLKSEDVVKVQKDVLEKSYDSMGRQAVGIVKNN